MKYTQEASKDTNVREGFALPTSQEVLPFACLYWLCHPGVRLRTENQM